MYDLQLDNLFEKCLPAVVGALSKGESEAYSAGRLISFEALVAHQGNILTDP